MFGILESGFDLVRWCGVLYLLYLGVQRWRGAGNGEVRGRRTRDYDSAATEGFVVALTNPGTMLFFIAFFPQFLSESMPVGPQLTLMALTFMVLTVVVDIGYALLAARLGRSLHEPKQRVARDRLAGAILMIAAVALALLNVS